MPCAGVDVGSISAEAVLVKNKTLVDYVICRTGADSRAACLKVLDQLLKKTGLKQSALKYIVATGYGRANADFAHKKITEITCHGRGAYFWDSDVRTVIDIGGQDSKAIRLDSEGRVVDFAMNDKCAAGTGRFLEVMAEALEVPLDKLDQISAQAKNPVAISSVCTVFAESEVVSLISCEQPVSDIAQGLHLAVAERTAGLLARVGLEEKVMMTGGVALSRAVVKALSGKLKIKIKVAPVPQIAGALGAALLAEEEHQAAKAALKK